MCLKANDNCPCIIQKVQFRSVQLVSCNPMDCSTSGFPVQHSQSPLSRRCHPTISSSVISFSSCLQSFPASGSFPVSQFFASGVQSIGVSALTSKSKKMQTQRTRPCGDGGQDWSDAVTKQGVSEATRHWRRQNRSSHRAFGGSVAQLTSLFQTSVSRTERMNFCGLKFLEICYSSNRKLILMGFPYGEIYFPRSMVFKQLFQGLDPSVQLGHYWESRW